MKPFMALVGILFRKLHLDRAVREHGIITDSGRITWALDLGLWDPAKPNQSQNPDAWQCAIDLPRSVGGGVVRGIGRDGAEAMTAAIVELDRRLQRPPRKVDT